MEDESLQGPDGKTAKVTFDFRAVHLRNIANQVCPKIIEVLKVPQKTRSVMKVRELAPLARKLEFFSERNLTDQSISDILAVMDFREIQKDEFVI